MIVAPLSCFGVNSFAISCCDFNLELLAELVLVGFLAIVLFGENSFAISCCDFNLELLAEFVLVGLVEFLGGIFLILGLFVNLISVLLIIDMVVAILLVHIPKGFLISNGGYEFPLALLAGLVTLAILGQGKLSLQKAFKK